MQRLVLLVAIVALAAGIWFVVGTLDAGPAPVGIASETHAARGAAGSTSVGQDPEGGDPNQVIEPGLERFDVEPAEASAVLPPGLLRVLVTMSETVRATEPSELTEESA